MSDGEIYLRLNVPDGLQTNGQQPEMYMESAQHESADGQTSIKQEPRG